MELKPTSIFLCVAVLIVLTLTIIDIGPAEPAKATITNVKHPTTATDMAHVGLNISTTIKNVGGTSGIFGVIAQPNYSRTEGVWIEPGDECLFTHIDGVYMPNHDYDIQLQAYCFTNGSYRIDDTENITILLDKLPAFRELCLNEGAVTCSWSVLKTQLEDQTVSLLWWDLTRDERHSIAIEIAENTMNCMFTDPCVVSALVRYLKITSADRPYDTSPDHWTIYEYYWSCGGGYESCWLPDVCYNIPGHIISVYSAPCPNNHAMAAILIDEDMSSLDMPSLDSWVIFEYTHIDFTPEDPDWKDWNQHRVWKPAELYTLCYYGSCNQVIKGNDIAEFYT